MKTQNTIKTIGTLAVICVTALPTNSFALPIGEDPISAYGDKIIFDVFRKGSAVGTHEVNFSRDGQDVIAKTRFEVSIKILIVPVYSYVYTSKERWRNGKLISLQAETNDNGELSNLDITRKGEDLSLSGSGGEFIAPGVLYPTTHWNSGVIGSTQVINTITGKINDVELQNRGIEIIETQHGNIQSTHFAYRGDLNTEVWYDKSGKWTKMRFAGKDGAMIEYKCRVCRADPLKTDRLPVNDLAHANGLENVTEENSEHGR